MDLLFRMFESSSSCEFFSSCHWYQAHRVCGATHGMENNFAMGEELRHATMLEF